ESLPPERQTMTLSPSSIMLKSLMARPVSRIRRLVSLLASKRSRFKRSASSALGGCDSGAVTGSACMGVLDEVLSTAALQLDADRGAVGKCQRLADADADLPDFGEIVEDTRYQLLCQRFQQVHMFACAFVYDRMAQFAVVQHCLDVVVLHLLRNFHIEFGIDVQGLCGPQFVFQDADSGIQGELFKNNASGEHVKSVLKEGEAENGSHHRFY